MRNPDFGPDEYTIDDTLDGVNLIYSQLSRPLIEQLRKTHLLGVWFYKKQSTENSEMYLRVF